MGANPQGARSVQTGEWRHATTASASPQRLDAPGARRPRRLVGMTEHRPATGAVALVPWAAFILADIVAGIAYGEPVRPDRVPGTSVACLGFVALPCLFPLAVVRPGWPLHAVLATLTAVDVVAAVARVASDDAQAGLAVLLVAEVALPLGAAILAGRAITSWLRR